MEDLTGSIPDSERELGEDHVTFDRKLHYWRGRLQTPAPDLEFQRSRPRTVLRDFPRGCASVHLSSDTKQRLDELAQRLGVTLSSVICASWAVLISRMTDQGDLVIGIPGITSKGIGPVAPAPVHGFLPLRLEVEGGQSVEQFVKQVDQAMHEVHHNEHFPFQGIIDALFPQSTLSHRSLVKVTFSLKPAREDDRDLSNGTQSTPKDNGNELMPELSLSLWDNGHWITGNLNYAADLFDAVVMEEWATRFDVILQAATNAHSDCRIGKLSIFLENEYHQIVEKFNFSEAPAPSEKTIQQLFENQVERTPAAIAAVEKSQSLSYAELNREANQLARYLKARGVENSECIPILMPRCLQMLIAQLAVLKCGGAYVPVDPALPPERQAFIVEDCRAKRLLSLQPRHEGDEWKEIDWIDYTKHLEDLHELRSENLRDPFGLASELPVSAQLIPAYVMYTSGSTGVPKGVIVPHRAITRLVVDADYTQIRPEDCVVHCSNPAFDAVTFETWGALLNGAKLLVVPQSCLLEPNCYRDLLLDHSASVLIQTTALFNQYADTFPDIYRTLRYLLVGGEAADAHSMRKVLSAQFYGRLLNVYGPTETTTFATWYPTERLSAEAASVPIGKPIANTCLYIVDPQFRSVPIGFTGELHIGGPGVAHGYLNRPDLTAERFIADPFGETPGARMYRTGDLGCWQASGDIEFLGRKDRQVKIRGFRIELGEIESSLTRHPRVRMAAVLAREDTPGEKRLVAYIVWEESSCDCGPQAINDLREHLTDLLPTYMIPNAFVFLESFPLTSNGKLDHRALPVPAPSEFGIASYEPPDDDIEQGLAEIWQELLSARKVGRRDDFFALGGNSLLGMRLITKVVERFAVALSTTDIYMTPTIAEMARVIASRRGVNDTSGDTKSAEFEQGFL